MAAGIPEQVCLKANWSGLRTGEICEREARFYHLISKGLDCPVPKTYYADWDGDGWGNGIVVMEDLAIAPGAFGASSDHLGVDAVASAVESLALVHGALWGDARLESFDWLAPSMGTDNDTEQVIQFWHYIWYNLTDPAYEAVVPRWVYDTPEVMNHVLDELAAYERERPGPRCLVHGDAHQGNSFLRADGERVWVDWQLVRKGSPWRDVSYLVIGALTVDERRSADRDLVEHYRQRLIATGAKGCPIATTPGNSSCVGPAMARRPGWATSTNGVSVAVSRWSSASSRPAMTTTPSGCSPKASGPVARSCQAREPSDWHRRSRPSSTPASALADPSVCAHPSGWCGEAPHRPLNGRQHSDGVREASRRPWRPTGAASWSASASALRRPIEWMATSTSVASARRAATVQCSQGGAGTGRR